MQTRYAGCLFRSRLEARWAVFFDHLGIRWRYEHQGYDLGKEGSYLPDFLLYPDTALEEQRNGEWRYLGVPAGHKFDHGRDIHA